ncbi:hypothetical protein HK105_201323 [Polyrhizophydium stewartii]|uniref:Ankyrin repeat protein n=1 Tax=Polyrhizophydium stewartii TaxID=2732419 RepID=A0ABR4NHP5_9FUNG
MSATGAALMDRKHSQPDGVLGKKSSKGRLAVQRSHWDRLPLELHLQIVEAAGLLTQLTFGLIRDVEALRIEQQIALWREALALNWQGNLAQLPKRQLFRLPAHVYWVVSSRTTFERLRRLGGHSAELLWHIPARNRWDDLTRTIPLHELCSIAAASGALSLLRHLIASSSSAILGTQHLLAAVRGGHLEIVKLFHDVSREAPDNHRHNALDCAWSPVIMEEAASYGHIDIVEWMSANRREGCTSDAMDGAAANGHLRMVRWLHSNRSEGFTTQAMDGAAANGHVEVVAFLHEHRVEGCTRDAMDMAARGGHLEVVQYLHANRTEGCTHRAMDWAAGRGHLATVAWLHENRSEGCTTEAMDAAALWGHVHVLEWLHTHRNEGCSKRAIVHAANHGRVEAIRWLLKSIKNVDWDYFDAIAKARMRQDDEACELLVEHFFEGGASNPEYDAWC